MRIPKYWEYPDGIYFKVLDQEFLAEHQRQPLRFSENGTNFIDTGVKLPGPSGSRARRVAEVRQLPPQSEVLKQAAPTASGSRARGAQAHSVRREEGGKQSRQAQGPLIL